MDLSQWQQQQHPYQIGRHTVQVIDDHETEIQNSSRILYYISNENIVRRKEKKSRQIRDFKFIIKHVRSPNPIWRHVRWVFWLMRSQWTVGEWSRLRQQRFPFCSKKERRKIIRNNKVDSSENLCCKHCMQSSLRSESSERSTTEGQMIHRKYQL